MWKNMQNCTFLVAVFQKMEEKAFRYPSAFQNRAEENLLFIHSCCVFLEQKCLKILKLKSVCSHRLSEEPSRRLRGLQRHTKWEVKGWNQCFLFYWTHIKLLFSLLPSAALSIVKEVANHANDIMKQGVRLRLQPCLVVFGHISLLIFLFCFQDNFQKLMQIQYSLNGHHEIVQPGRVSPDSVWVRRSTKLSVSVTNPGLCLFSVFVAAAQSNCLCFPGVSEGGNSDETVQESHAAAHVFSGERKIRWLSL